MAHNTEAAYAVRGSKPVALIVSSDNSFVRPFSNGRAQRRSLLQVVRRDENLLSPKIRSGHSRS
jgi:hypothetical protein